MTISFLLMLLMNYIHRSKPWGLYWLKRYREKKVQRRIEKQTKKWQTSRYTRRESTTGDKKNELESNRQQQGWTTKQVDRRSNSSKKKWRHKVYHYTHIFTDSCTNGDSNRESTKKDTCKHSIKRKEKEGFKKESERYCGYSPERVHSSIT